MTDRDSLDSFTAITQCIKNYCAQITADAQSFISDAQAEILADLFENNSPARKRKQKEKFNLEKAYYEKLDFEINKAIAHHINLQREEQLLLMKEEKQRNEEKREAYNHAIAVDIEKAHLHEQRQLELQIQSIKTELEHYIIKIEQHIEELTQFIIELKNNIEEQRKASCNQFIENTKKWLSENYQIQNNMLTIPHKSSFIHIEYDKLLNQIEQSYNNHFDKENIYDLSSIQNDFKNIIHSKISNLSDQEGKSLANKISHGIINNSWKEINNGLSSHYLQKRELVATEKKLKVLTHDLNKFKSFLKNIDQLSSKNESYAASKQTKSLTEGVNKILTVSKDTLNQSKRNITAITSTVNKLNNATLKSTPKHEKNPIIFKKSR